MEQSLPAAGQGAVGIECRVDDEEVKALLAPLSDATTTTCVLLERALNTRLQGGCQVPIGGYAIEQNGEISFACFLSEKPMAQRLFVRKVKVRLKMPKH